MPAKLLPEIAARLAECEIHMLNPSDIGCSPVKRVNTIILHG